MADEMENQSFQTQQAVAEALKKEKKKKKKKRLIIFAVILVVVVILIIVLNRPKDYDFSNPDATVTVDTILNDFTDDSANASEKYSDKVVAVTGKVLDILDYTVTLEAYDDNLWLYFVYATMENSDDLKKFKTGETATVVGVCDKTTLLGDVELEKCVINDDFAITPDYDGAEKIDLSELIEAYNENKVNADEKYKNKVLTVSGVVIYVADDYIVIEPEDADLFDWDCDTAVYFEDNDDISKAKEDKKITVTGECYSDADFYTVKLCRSIVK